MDLSCPWIPGMRVNVLLLAPKGLNQLSSSYLFNFWRISQMAAGDAVACEIFVDELMIAGCAEAWEVAAVDA